MLECQNLLELEKRLARSETPGEGDIKKKNNLMFILVMFELLSDILHWDYVCHSAIPWKIGVSEQFPVLVWSPTPPPTHIPYSSNTIIPHPSNAKKNKVIQERQFCMIEKQVWLFGENVTKLWARAWQWKFLRLSQTLT